MGARGGGGATDWGRNTSSSFQDMWFPHLGRVTVRVRVRVSVWVRVRERVRVRGHG